MASSTGLWALKTASSPPTQMASLPDLAPFGPPLTGASSMWAPLSAKILLIRRTTVGEFVLRSKYARPRPSPARMPLSPRATASTSGGVGSEVNTTSLASATCLGESAHFAPAARCGLAASWPEVVHDHLVATLLDVGGHVVTHQPEPDESDSHDFFSSKTPLARARSV